MKKLLFFIFIVCLTLAVTSKAYAVYGYITEKETGHVISYFDLDGRPTDTDSHSFTVCVSNDKPEIWVAPVPYSFELQTCEGALFAQFSSNLSFPMYYSPIGRCLSYLSSPYTDESSVLALATLNAYVENLLTNEIFTETDLTNFKAVLEEFNISIGGA